MEHADPVADRGADQADGTCGGGRIGHGTIIGTAAAAEKVRQTLFVASRARIADADSRRVSKKRDVTAGGGSAAPTLAVAPPG
jgi:hypothetical protein